MDGAMEPREVVIGYYREVWERRQPNVIPQFFSPNYVNHAGSRGVLMGPDGIRKNYDGLIAAFPDVAMTLDDVFGEGDKVVVRYTMRGTHSGPFQGVAATGKTIEVPGIGIYRVAGGKINASWVVRDSLTLLKQIGAAT